MCACVFAVLRWFKQGRNEGDGRGPVHPRGDAVHEASPQEQPRRYPAELNRAVQRHLQRSRHDPLRTAVSFAVLGCTVVWSGRVVLCCAVLCCAVAVMCCPVTCLVVLYCAAAVAVVCCTRGARKKEEMEPCIPLERSKRNTNLSVGMSLGFLYESTSRK